MNWPWSTKEAARTCDHPCTQCPPVPIPVLTDTDIRSIIDQNDKVVLKSVPEYATSLINTLRDEARRGNLGTKDYSIGWEGREWYREQAEKVVEEIGKLVPEKERLYLVCHGKCEIRYRMKK